MTLVMLLLWHGCERVRTSIFCRAQASLNISQRGNALKLYHMPGACSRVTLNALEEIGVEYEDQALDLSKGDQRSPEFMAVNPRGKIPVLLVNGQLITENSAILLL